MTGRAIATLGLTIALSALLCAQQVPPPPPPNPPPEGAPITPALSRLLASHDEPVRVATGLGSLAGIVWTKVGTLFVAEVTQSIIIEWSPTAGAHPLRGSSGGALGLALDSAGRLLSAERTARRVTRSDLINGTMMLWKPCTRFSSSVKYTSSSFIRSRLNAMEPLLPLISNRL